MSAARDLHERTAAQVRSAMKAAMRTDPHALDRLAEAGSGSLDPHSASFLRSARTLALATSAALTGVLTTHRYGHDPHGRLICVACGVDRCRTVRGVSDVLASYGLQTCPVDRPEAWRRADAWYASRTGRPVLIGVEPFDEGFVARPAIPPSEMPDRVLIIDRETGALTLWPAYGTDALASHYYDYKRGML